uniref:(California timema) hypothetical protein n=1 Tax=Timema californicum TaxID=61474 RepID=A0A7R9P411_TIMCA|nr:unnamed protein product [Timema californicum]
MVEGVISMTAVSRMIGNRIPNYKEVVEASKIDVLELEAKQWVFYILFKLHHLLRTQALPGIYSLPNTAKLSVLEEQLKVLQFTDYMKILHKQRKAMRNRCRNKPSTQLIFKGPLRRCEKYWRERNNTHPGRLFAQGVYDDDFPKVLKPHDEAQGKDIRVNDLMKFTRVKYNDRDIYLEKEPRTITKMTLRETRPDKNISKTNFTTILRPVDLFEELMDYDYN